MNLDNKADPRAAASGSELSAQSTERRAFDIEAIWKAGGVTGQALERVKKAQDLLLALPEGIPADTKRQIVEASLKAFEISIHDIVVGASQELKALQVFVGRTKSETENSNARSKKRIEELQSEIERNRNTIKERDVEIDSLVGAAQEVLDKVTPILEFFEREQTPVTSTTETAPIPDAKPAPAKEVGVNMTLAARPEATPEDQVETKVPVSAQEVPVNLTKEVIDAPREKPRPPVVAVIPKPLNLPPEGVRARGISPWTIGATLVAVASIAVAVPRLGTGDDKARTTSAEALATVATSLPGDTMTDLVSSAEPRGIGSPQPHALALGVSDPELGKAALPGPSKGEPEVPSKATPISAAQIAPAFEVWKRAGLAPTGFDKGLDDEIANGACRWGQVSSVHVLLCVAESDPIASEKVMRREIPGESKARKWRERILRAGIHLRVDSVSEEEKRTRRKIERSFKKLPE